MYQVSKDLIRADAAIMLGYMLIYFLFGSLKGLLGTYGALL